MTLSLTINETFIKMALITAQLNAGHSGGDNVSSNRYIYIYIERERERERDLVPKGVQEKRTEVLENKVDRM